MHRLYSFWLSVLFTFSTLILAPQNSFAYPFWAQQNYASPREATGKIVCANCHLAKKITQVEVPQAVMPDSVFKAVISVPYDINVKEVATDGSKTPLQVGAVVMLPDGFTLAPQDRWTEEMKEETEGIFYTPYSKDQPNILLVGPLPGDKHQEIIFPILSPDPAVDNSIHFGKYSIHVGGNRGRGQVYPTGEKSNNTVFTTMTSGTISAINTAENGSSVVEIRGEDGSSVSETIPVGPTLQVSIGDKVKAGSPLTNDPNVGGFGQLDTEIVLQNPVRIYGMLAFFAAVALAQILLVLKKRQVEKIQAAEGV
uniref:Cytochrome f n=1 Tax=Paulinella chromatophora TaxID=39717 RepID=B1X5F1_PAUCH|nr:apocytochrome f precursor [Paulinella chromatophora]ACB43170.1 apocytochrome f precursor [Paulinella chromatophora]|eukprot:gb/GEZN01003162.1/.p1 GENE.gb/GEZN01003162.1/~~gb/GEZN01003162.1/.p1  ORF type:complete len:311 (-),score=10.75 gb/GEZN01003162.1/:575-1507(-)